MQRKQPALHMTTPPAVLDLHPHEARHGLGVLAPARLAYGAVGDNYRLVPKTPNTL
jgi:hypothetical protein